MKYTRIPQDTFDTLQMDAGILLSTFDPTGATEVHDDDIITATTGGIHITMVPEYSDLGEDVDNCPNNIKELKHLDSWTATVEFTALDVSPENIKLSLGAADIDQTNTGKVTPRRNLSQADFTDLWWVGDKADGGYVGAHIFNALSTGGLDLQTTKNGKGQLKVTVTGHVSINDQDKMPMEFFSIDGDEQILPSILLKKKIVNVDKDATVTLTADVIPAGTTVTFTSSNGEVATVGSSTGVVTGVAAGSCIVTASITVDGVTYSDTCTVIVKATA